MKNIIDYLREWSSDKTGKAYIFHDSSASKLISYCDLYNKVLEIAAIINQKTQYGDRVLILLNSGINYIISFLGCLISGRIAVTGYPPINKSKQNRIISISNDCESKVAIVESEILSGYNNLDKINDFIILNEVSFSNEYKKQNFKFVYNEIAFIQYTSGSTSSPKGVMISHKNLVANLKLLSNLVNSALPIHTKKSMVTWLPPYHDMGLIWGLLLPLYAKFPCHIITPISFTQNPLSWLKLISDTQSSISAAPNFAYDLCIQTINDKQMQGLDLSTWHLAVNGAEPIMIRTTNDFIKKFSKVGFPENAICPGYGLAESTLMVSANSNFNNVNKKISDIPCGKACHEHEVLIVNPKTNSLCENYIVGEIWVSGPSVAKGYWNNACLTKEVFKAKLDNNLSKEYLRTGDLGYLDKEGNIYVSGRIKDLIIINGENIYPQDIEETVVQSHNSLIKHGCIAFAMKEENTKEELVIIQEIHRHMKDYQRLYLLIRENLYKEHSIIPDKIIFIVQSSLPKTSSGKLQRDLCKKLFINNKLKVVNENKITQDYNFNFTDKLTKIFHETFQKRIDFFVQYIINKISSVIWLKVDSECYNCSLITLGFNSVKVSILLSKIYNEIGFLFSYSQIMNKTIIDLATILAKDFKLSKKNILPLNIKSMKKRFYLSNAQQRLWFLDQFIDKKAIYNITFGFKIIGHINLKFLRKSFDRIIYRHNSLRTKFVFTKGIYYQVIQSSNKFKLQLIDCSTQNNSKHDTGDLVVNTINLLKVEEFNLSELPLFKVSLLKVGKDRHILFITMHHIISDGWSIEVFLKELSILYNSYLEGKEPELPVLPIQYVDFALWQRNWLKGEILDKQINYWKRKLDGMSEMIGLPTDFSRPQNLSYKGNIHTHIICKSILDKIKDLAKDRKMTLFMVLLAIFYILLRKYCKQEDIIVGTPVSNRHYPNVGNLIGFFVNALSLRINLQGKRSIGDLLEEVKNITLEAYDNQDVPFEQLVDELKIVRKVNANPIFQVMFVLQENWGDSLSLKDLEIEAIDEYEKINYSKFDLTIFVNEAVEGLKVRFEYSTDLFNVNTIKRMSKHFEVLMNQVVEMDSSWCIDDVDIMNKEEEAEIIKMSKGEYIKDYLYSSYNIQTMFEEVVRENPDRTAVLYEGEQISYKELNNRSNKLARYLRGLGIGVEISVGICINRSIEMIIGVLGILKSGGVYVPLDPEYPEDRLRYMLKDTKAPILLTEKELSKKFINWYEGKVVNIDEEWNDINKESGTNVNSITKKDNLAYIIYTSGSTGKPKGVPIEYKGLVNRLLWMKKKFNIHNNDIFIQKTSINFDVSIWEIFLPLVCGSKQILAKQNAQADISYIFGLMIQYYISIIHYVPSILKDFIKNNVKNTRKYLRFLIASGEVLSNDLINNFHLKCNSKIYNLYGPTEATIDVTYFDCQNYKNFTIPIGKSISNTNIYILDEEMRLLPVGVIGEIYIGGIGLARGYMNRPGLTSERFIANPYVTEKDIKKVENLRLYKTGDLARYLEDGNIEYIGRIDYQVKIRGFRIELGEIEAALNNNSLVDNSVVLVRNDNGNKKLIAYVILEEEKYILESLSELNAGNGDKFSVLGGDQTIINNIVEELRVDLLNQLPEYMVPSYFVLINKLPLTINGKIDKNILLNINNKNINYLQEEYEEARNDTEKELVEIWREVLEIEKIGINDNFFKIGGHSLLATQVISRIRTKYNIELALKCIFENPKIKDLSQIITRELKIRDNKLVTSSLKKIGNKKEVPLSYAQQRLWFLDELLKNIPIYNITIPFKLCGELNIEILIKSLNKIVSRHEILRTVFSKKKDGTAYQKVLSKIDIIEVEDLKGCKDINFLIQKHISEEIKRKFNLEQGPLIKIKILKIKKVEHIMIVNMHHIISDGWSIGVFNEELSKCYNSYIYDKKLPLKDLEVQYRDYSIWQKKWLRGRLLQEQLEYWKKRLFDAPTLINLPTDRVRPKELTYKGGNYSYDLSSIIVEKCKDICNKEGISLYMLLLGAFQILLHKYSNQDDIVIGTPIANRRYKETEGLIGFFVNTLVIRSKVYKKRKIKEFLQEIKTVTLEAYDHQDIPFEQLVDYLGVDRSLNKNPVYQVLFVLQNTDGFELGLEGIKASYITPKSNVSKFDLSFSLSQEIDGRIKIMVEYAKDLYNESTIERLVSYYGKIIEEIVKDLDQAIRDVNIVDIEERAKILEMSGGEELNYNSEDNIQTMFEEVVRENPDRTAVLYEGDQISYKELNNRSNKLARYLRGLGIGVEIPVGICINRSIEMIIGVLGILKSGGVYVPLDPEYPEDRLRYMLEDTKAPILLTEKELGDKFISWYGGKVVNIDEEWNDINKESGTNVNSITKKDNLAYIIYTSGSTGKPKGSLISHINILRLYAATLKLYHFNKNDTWTLFHSYAFDFSIWEMFGALLHGGRLIIVSYLKSRLPKEFYNLLIKEQVTILNNTPSAFGQLIEYIKELNKKNHLRYLKWIIFGGEALNYWMLKPWFDFYKDNSPLLVNMYGITETTVHVSHKKIEENNLKSISSLVGSNIEDLSIYILDEEMRLLPVGVVGEMYIGGAGLARGYMNRPGLTSERFIANPYVTEKDIKKAENLRLYKTGDLARYLEDGNIEYIGRIDDQVKIRGFRIELGEIEVVLNNNSLVDNSVVLVRNDNGNKKLIAYVILEEEKYILESLSELNAGNGDKFSVLGGDQTIINNIVEELRVDLLNQLPEYMVPSYFVLINKLPLTINGKIDKNILLNINNKNINYLQEEYEEARNDTEKELVEIWREILDIDKIGINDNFFKIGGDSILGIRIVVLAKERKISFTIADLYKYPTVAGLIANSSLFQFSGFNLDKIKPFSLIKDKGIKFYDKNIEDAYPMTSLQQGMVFHSMSHTGETIYQDIFCYRLEGLYNHKKFIQALKIIIAKHEILRTSFSINSYNQPLQLINRKVQLNIKYENIDSLSKLVQKKVINEWFHNEKFYNFDLSLAPLFKITIFQFSKKSFFIGFTFHHAILDGWSVASLITELFKYYNEVPDNTTILNNKLDLGYNIYVALELDALSSKPQKEYWADKLKDCEYTPLPSYLKNREIINKRFNIYTKEISSELTKCIVYLSKTLNIPIKNIFLAAHIKALSIILNTKNIVTGLITNGRPEVKDGDKMLGLFLNTLPFKINIKNKESWLDLILNVHIIEKELLPYRWYPLFEILKEKENKVLFDILFNFIDFHIYDQLSINDSMVITQSDVHEVSNFPLIVNFCKKAKTDNNYIISFEHSVNSIGISNIKQIASVYIFILKMLASDVNQLHNYLFEDYKNNKKKIINNIEASNLTFNPIHKVFQEEAEINFHRIALVYKDKQITYGFLNNESNKFANYLLKIGIRKGDVITVSADKSIGVIIVIISIFKIGAVFIPIDPNHPKKRLSFVFNDAKSSILITQNKYKERFSFFNNTTLYIDDIENQVNEISCVNLTNQNFNNDLAYIIYTSGSTGIPKGTMITYHNLFNKYLSWSIAYKLKETRKTHLQMASISFDVFIGDLIRSLCFGGKLLLIDSDVVIEPGNVVRLINKNQANYAEFVPAILNNISSYIINNKIKLNSLEVIISGSDIWYMIDYNRIPSYFNGKVRIINSYGTTESTIDSAYFESDLIFNNNELYDYVTVPIGYPLPGDYIYIFDSGMMELPTGIAGEIYIGGPGLARGYMNRPGLTAERFMANPYATKEDVENAKNLRLYKTGDLGRYLENGNIEYISRVDDQVKIRGFRIELGEVESVLNSNELVDKSVVLTKDTEMNKSLISYIVLHAKERKSLLPLSELKTGNGNKFNILGNDKGIINDIVKKLRIDLLKKLPEYMVPSYFVLIDGLPLTINGKIDKKTLLEIDSKSINYLQEEYVGAKNKIEKKLAQIWQEILGIKKVGIYDNFFKIGGHSLLLTQIVLRVKKDLKQTIDLTLFLNNATIFYMAKLIDKQDKEIIESNNFINDIILDKEINDNE